MKIAYTADQLLRCGGIRVPFEHCRELRRRGHDARIFARGWEDGVKDWIDRYNVPTARLEGLQGFQADVLVSVWWPMLDELLAYPAGKRFHLVQGQDWRAYPEGNDWRLRNEQAMQRTDYRFLAVSPWAAESCKDALIVPNGVDAAFWRPIAWEPMQTDVRILVEASNDDPMKGREEALQAAALVKAGRPNVSIWLITKNGVSDPRVDRAIIDPNDVTILNAYQNCHVLVKASHYEGFGLPHLEGMSVGIPLVTTLCGGNDFCTHGVNCSVIPEMATPVGIADCIVTILDDKAYRDRIVEGGKVTARMYSWQRSVDRLLVAFNG